MLRRAAALLAVLPLALAACKSPEQRLVDRRRELRDTLDPLYSWYGGVAVAKVEGPGDGGLLGRVVGEVDRAYFDGQCLAVGRGERPLALSGKLDAFLREEKVARECRKAADLQLEIDELQREVGEPR
jgi:hypothetical protein